MEKSFSAWTILQSFKKKCGKSTLFDPHLEFSALFFYFEYFPNHSLLSSYINYIISYNTQCNWMIYDTLCMISYIGLHVFVNMLIKVTHHLDMAISSPNRDGLCVRLSPELVMSVRLMSSDILCITLQSAIFISNISLLSTISRGHSSDSSIQTE